MGKSVTICWECKNFWKCAWARGVPVKGWEADPITIRDQNIDVDSFIVKKCPHFISDNITKCTYAEIGHILGISISRVANLMRRSPNKLNWLLKQRGWQVHQIDGGYWLEKI